MTRQQMNNSTTTIGRTFGGLANSVNILDTNNNAGKKELIKKPLGEGDNKENISKKELVTAEKKWDNLDLEDMDDPLMVAEYIGDIVDYMRKLEVLLNSLINEYRSQVHHILIIWNAKRKSIGICGPFLLIG
jgi:hypothetical protein